MWGLITSVLGAIFGPPSPQAIARSESAPYSFYPPSYSNSRSQKLTDQGGPSAQDYSMTSEAKRTREEYLKKFSALLSQERTHEADESDKLESKVFIDQPPRLCHGTNVATDKNATVTITFRVESDSPYEPAKGDLILLYQMNKNDETRPTRTREGFYGAVTLVGANGYSMEGDANTWKTQMRNRLNTHYQWYIKPTINEAFFKRCDEALSQLQSRSCSIFQVILGIAQPTVDLPIPSRASWKPCIYLNDSIYDVHKPLETKLQEDPQLNPAQEVAISRALTSNIALIQGPPGTGKTCTIVQLIKRLSLSIGQATGKILCVAPSNAAADHLAICLLKAGLIVYRPRSKGSLKQIATSHPELYKIGRGARAVRDFSVPPRKFSERTQSGACATADVVCATCCTAGSFSVSSHKFTYLIVDEAAQATE